MKKQDIYFIIIILLLIFIGYQVFSINSIFHPPTQKVSDSIKLEKFSLADKQYIDSEYNKIIAKEANKISLLNSTQLDSLASSIDQKTENINKILEQSLENQNKLRNN